MPGEAREAAAEPAGQRAHRLGRDLLGVLRGVPDRGDDQVGQRLGVVGVDRLRVDGQAEQLTGPGDQRGHQTTTRAALDLLALQVGLRFHQLVLHRLRLREQVRTCRSPQRPAHRHRRTPRSPVPTASLCPEPSRSAGQPQGQGPPGRKPMSLPSLLHRLWTALSTTCGEAPRSEASPRLVVEPRTNHPPLWTNPIQRHPPLSPGPPGHHNALPPGHASGTPDGPATL